MLHVRPVGASWAARCASAACRVGTMCVPLVHTLWRKIVTKTSRREEWLSWVGATIAVLVVQGSTLFVAFRAVAQSEDARARAHTTRRPPTRPLQGRLSIVLPCAYEHAFMVRTVRSVYRATPSRHLAEILVVDDGSEPPLKSLLPNASRYRARFIRHERPLGLIAAKNTGGNAAVGDVVVFFDCHVLPAENYWQPFLEHTSANYRRVVVPTITKLDVKTWQDVSPPRQVDGMSKCYLTFDAEFKWTTDRTDAVPVMSGGLLAITKRWWNEPGGYDATMAGW